MSKPGTLPIPGAFAPDSVPVTTKMATLNKNTASVLVTITTGHSAGSEL